MIVICGATGSMGPHLVKSLQDKGVPFRAAVRSPEAARQKLGAQVPLVPFDLERPATFAEALRGASQVFCAVGGATGTPELVACEQRLIDAAKAAGVGHYVKLSGIDAQVDSPSKIQRMHAEIERHLRASGLSATVLKPSFFFQNFLGLQPAIAQGVLPVPTGQAKAGLIDARDIADVAAAALTTPALRGATYTLTGPRSLSHGEVAAILSAVLERPVQHVDLPAQAFEQSLVQAGLPGWFANLLADVYATVFAPGLIDRVTGDVRRVTGHEPRSLEAFVREHRAAFLGAASAAA